MTIGLLMLAGLGCSDSGGVPDPDDVQDSGVEDCVDADGDGFSDCDGDEDDADPYSYPGSDAVDDDGDGYSEDDGDCNDDPDDGGAQQSPDDLWYADGDGDGYGAGASVASCEQPEGYGLPGDLDDADPHSFPGAIELCDGVWNNHAVTGWVEDADAVSVQRADGTWQAIAPGSASGSTRALISDAGATVLVCPGTSYARLEIAADDVTVVGVGAEQSTLDAAHDGSVVVAEDVAGLLIADVTLTHGSGHSCQVDFDLGLCGGGLFLSGVVANVQGVVLEDNSVSVSGAGAWLEHASDVVLDSVWLEGNEAVEGGAGLGVYEASSVTILDSVFIDNHAGFGGGLSVVDTSDVVVERVSFESNDSRYGGGARVTGGTTSTWIDVVFEDNTASGNGKFVGGASLEGHTTTLSSVRFENNAAWLVGGLRLSGCVATVSDASFIGNETEYGSPGGGLLVSNSVLTLDASTFSGNVAGYQGGGISGEGSDLTISNTAFDGNAADEGGGVHVDRSSLALSDVTFTANDAVYGGGVFFEDSDGVLDGVRFEGNTVVVWGGAMVLESSSATLRDSAVTGNISSYQGGGVALDSGVLSVVGADFADNVPEDLRHLDQGQSYSWGEDASFECSPESCD